MSIKSKIQSLIAAANAKTGESDATLTDAVQTLVDGYGQGGSGSNEDAIISRSLSGSYTNSRVSAVGANALRSYAQLTSVAFPAATTIGSAAFFGCSNLVTASAPQVTSLGEEAFRDCSSLENVDMPKLSAISSQAFKNTKIPAAFWPGIKAGMSAFSGCKSLVTAVVGTTDYSYTFYGCSALTAADLTNNRSTIVVGCFNGDALLSTLVIRGTSICNLNNRDAFNGTPFRNGGAGGTIYIPKALYDHLGDGSSLDYKAATNWSTIDGYGTITWAQIEGSAYENAYVDGTPMPTS